MLRSLAKDTAARIATITRLDTMAREPFVVGYHRVVERVDVHRDDALPAMEISVSMLEKHIDWIGRNFEIVPIDDLRRRSKKRTAAITFDDGYSDVFYNALPLLRRKGIPAAVFVVTDLVGTKEMPLHDRLYAILNKSGCRDPFLSAQGFLHRSDYASVLRFVTSSEAGQSPDALRPVTWEMLAKLRDAGWTIGSHSKTHAFLANESSDRVEEEISGSRTVLKEKLGIEASAFAYPGGVFNAQIVDTVRRSGYTLAFTDCRHRDERYPLLTIPRRGLWERSSMDRFGRFSGAIMSCHSASIFDRFSRCQISH